ncbi:NAD(P)-dependent oxidoreductase [Bacillus thuringiensis serovar cameroun]|nr:NAD(P)-dependent oxidoreductase [Bacillus thuringiensis serovar cameroun]
MIIVIGATGTIGSELLKRLIKLRIPTRALSRDYSKLYNQILDCKFPFVELITADATNSNSLRRAFKGGKQLFLALSNSPKQIDLESSVINVAVEAGIEHIVKISSPIFQRTSPVTVAKWHWEIERKLRESGIEYTILRPYAFMQNLLRFAPTIVKQGVFYGSMDDSSCNFIDCRDIADVAVEVLINRQKSGGIYTLTGSEIFSYPDIASELSIILNRTINYINMDPAELRRNLIHYEQMPNWLANHIVEIQAMSMKVQENPTETVKELIGKDPRTLRDFLHEHKKFFECF